MKMVEDMHGVRQALQRQAELLIEQKSILQEQGELKKHLKK
jgi:hypothetical protein